MTIALGGTNRDAGVSVVDVNLKSTLDVGSGLKIEFGFILDVESGTKTEFGGIAYVLDTDGRLIAHPDFDLVLRNSDMSGLLQVQAARAAGDADRGTLLLGEDAGLIDSIEPAGPLVKRLAAEAEAILRDRTRDLVGG